MKATKNRRAVIRVALVLALWFLAAPALAQPGKGKGGGGGGGNGLPANPNIAFGDITGGGLRLMDTRTGQVGKLAKNGGFPAWSPDGSRIAYRRDDRNQDIVIRNADGSGPVQSITAVWGRFGGGLDWSRAPTPNGREMLIYSELNATQTARYVYAVELDGSERIELLNDANAVGTEPRWSPFGDQFVAQRDGQLTIFSVGLVGGELAVVGTPTPFTNVPTFPQQAGFTCDWSNDGQRIVTYGADGYLWLFDPTNPIAPRPLVFAPGAYPTFDAADQRIYFNVRNGIKDSRIYSVDALTGGAPVLESGPLTDIWGPQCRRD